ncbi:MAG: hypothetical protein L3K14_06140 [Thermoplasmata archaeon]|nr:hypothetical protein [Thermoplasmata archaeon]
MRALTESEARLIRALLAAPGDSERELLDETRLPRSTYHAVRKRVYEEGWLRIRFVPHPACFELPFVTIALAHPFAESAVDLMERWSRPESNVILWGGAGLLFAVYLHHSRDEARRLTSGLADEAMRSRSFFLTTDTGPPSLPIYFDYEGVWSHLAGIPGSSQYPRPLSPSFPARSRSPVGPPSPGLIRSARNLVLRPVVADHEGRSGHFLGLLGLTRPEHRLLDDGWVFRRMLPDFSVLPPYQERRADQVVFVRGEILEGSTPAKLLQGLTEKCRVYPFLLAHDGTTLVVGTAGQSGPTPPAIDGSRPSVLGTLQEHLRRIEVDSEWVTSLTPVVDHRYDRVLADPGARPPRPR